MQTESYMSEKFFTKIRYSNSNKESNRFVGLETYPVGK
jgi:hypothetical protein